MKSRVLLGLLVFMFAGAAACPKKKATPEACVKACTKLALLLNQERNKQGQERSPALEVNTDAGQHNIDECAERCARDANEKHVTCLENVNTLQDWLTCDDGHNGWL